MNNDFTLAIDYEVATNGVWDTTTDTAAGSICAGYWYNTNEEEHTDYVSCIQITTDPNFSTGFRKIGVKIQIPQSQSTTSSFNPKEIIAVFSTTKYKPSTVHSSLSNEKYSSVYYNNPPELLQDGTVDARGWEYPYVYYYFNTPVMNPNTTYYIYFFHPTKDSQRYPQKALRSTNKGVEVTIEELNPIFIFIDSKWTMATPYIYTESQWKAVSPKIT